MPRRSIAPTAGARPKPRFAPSAAAGSRCRAPGCGNGSAICRSCCRSSAFPGICGKATQHQPHRALFRGGAPPDASHGVLWERPKRGSHHLLPVCWDSFGKFRTRAEMARTTFRFRSRRNVRHRVSDGKRQPPGDTPSARRRSSGRRSRPIELARLLRGMGETGRLAGAAMLGGIGILHRRRPFTELLGGFFLGNSVALLNLSNKLVLLAGDYVEVIIRQLAPLLADGTLHLLPLAFNLIPIHRDLLSSG